MTNDSLYSIKNGYRPNPSVRTMDKISGGEYWSVSRIKAAAYYQYSVYGFANQLIDDLGATSLVDVGCGPGIKLKAIHERHPHLDIVGIDQKSAIDYCHAHHGFGRWYVGDFEDPSTNLPPIRGDVVICSDVIEHLSNPDMLLHFLSETVRQDGIIILSTPDRDRLHGPDCTYCPNKAHVREWNAQELRTYLESRRFEILEQKFHYPVRTGFHRLFLKHVLWRTILGKNARYNQVLVLRESGSVPGAANA